MELWELSNDSGAPAGVNRRQTTANKSRTDVQRRDMGAADGMMGDTRLQSGCSEVWGNAAGRLGLDSSV